MKCALHSKPRRGVTKAQAPNCRSPLAAPFPKGTVEVSGRSSLSRSIVTSTRRWGSSRPCPRVVNIDFWRTSSIVFCQTLESTSRSMPSQKIDGASICLAVSGRRFVECDTWQRRVLPSGEESVTRGDDQDAPASEPTWWAALRCARWPAISIIERGNGCLPDQIKKIVKYQREPAPCRQASNPMLFQIENLNRAPVQWKTRRRKWEDLDASSAATW